MHLIWLRTDLRLHDNTALTAASQRGPVAAIYLITPQQWLAHDDAPCKVDFWLRNLHALSQTLGKLNIPLLIRHADTWDQAPSVLSQLCRELKAESVHVNEEYGIHESRRDSAVAQALEADGVTFHSYLDQLFFQPGSVLTKSGTYFQVFSQFRKVCYERLHRSMPRSSARAEAVGPPRTCLCRRPGRCCPNFPNIPARRPRLPTASLSSWSTATDAPCATCACPSRTAATCVAPTACPRRVSSGCPPRIC